MMGINMESVMMMRYMLKQSGTKSEARWMSSHLMSLAFLFTAVRSYTLSRSSLPPMGKATQIMGKKADFTLKSVKASVKNVQMSLLTSK